jgi:propanol-preferring alcohol dehydrogenase
MTHPERCAQGLHLMKNHGMMTAMVLESPRTRLVERRVPVPEAGPGQLLIKVHACGVCRTDLHILANELDKPALPLILGHEIVGTIAAAGKDVKGFIPGERVGIPWLGHTCGTCRYCTSGRENLCDNAGFTGYTINGGYAEYCVADAAYCFRIPGIFENAHACPLLCAGLIGYRSYRMVPANAQNIGMFGFGVAAHIITQIAVRQGKKVYAFTRPGDSNAQDFALRLGALWAGGSDENPPQELDAALVYASVGGLVPKALALCAKGGAVVCGGIHMSDIPSFPYDILRGERSIRSVANLTRRDGEELLALAAEVPVKTEVTAFPLPDANKAVDMVRKGMIEGAAVLTMPDQGT